MESLEAELERARELSVAALADAIETIGFECTRCGACCKAAEPAEGDGDREPHTATLFPDEARELRAAAEERFDEEYDWRDVARPMPYGVSQGDDGPAGETFEWAIQTDACGDCAFYAEDEDGTGACTVHGSRPLVCRTYPFSVVLASEASEGSSDSSDGALGGTSQPMGAAVDSVALPAQREASEAGDEAGMVRAHECEGLGRDIDREAAAELAAALKERAVRELEEAVELRDRYEPRPDADGVVVHDSEGAKRPDGTSLNSR
jgi:Fe-S-cluster containining protein